MTHQVKPSIWNLYWDHLEQGVYWDIYAGKKRQYSHEDIRDAIMASYFFDLLIRLDLCDIEFLSSELSTYLKV